MTGEQNQKSLASQFRRISSPAWNNYLRRMAKAKRYIKDETKRIEVLNILIDEGHIKTWAGIFDNIPRTTVAAHLGINNTRMKDLVNDPSALTLERLA